MTRILMSGFSREEEIAAANELFPDYLGFEFDPNKPNYVVPARALELKELLDEDITVVGAFADGPARFVAALLNEGLLDIALLCGSEDGTYIEKLRSSLRDPGEKALVQRYAIANAADVQAALDSTADMVLLEPVFQDGSFDWSLLQGFDRAFFLAGGLSAQNVGQALSLVNPTAVAVDAGIEHDGCKDAGKMLAFIQAVHAWDAENPGLSMLEALHPEYHESPAASSKGTSGPDNVGAKEGEDIR